MSNRGHLQGRRHVFNPGGERSESPPFFRANLMRWRAAEWGVSYGWVTAPCGVRGRSPRLIFSKLWRFLSIFPIPGANNDSVININPVTHCTTFIHRKSNALEIGVLHFSDVVLFHRCKSVNGTITDTYIFCPNLSRSYFTHCMDAVA